MRSDFHFEYIAHSLAVEHEHTFSGLSTKKFLRRSELLFLRRNLRFALSLMLIERILMTDGGHVLLFHGSIWNECQQKRKAISLFHDCPMCTVFQLQSGRFFTCIRKSKNLLFTIAATQRCVGISCELQAHGLPQNAHMYQQHCNINEHRVQQLSIYILQTLIETHFYFHLIRASCICREREH